MPLTRRSWMAGALAVGPLGVLAQQPEWPSKTVKVVI
ncbi:MAG: tripartite tricarboxylate transporter substrate binding protein, partial [Comamonadaceae bacterium]